jgi:hypothetical protein
MKTGTFMDIIGFHYNDIKSLFTSRIVNDDRKFDEDAFNTAFIKCAQKFGENIITYEDAVKYYWIAFNNTSKNNEAYNHKLELYDEFSDYFSEEQDDADLEYFYHTVMDAISQTFDENDMHIYNLHICHGWSKEEIKDAGYDCKKFESKIKAIHEFVKEYCKTHNLCKYVRKILKKFK